MHDKEGWGPLQLYKETQLVRAAALQGRHDSQPARAAAQASAHLIMGSSMPACTACARARWSAESDRLRRICGRITYHLRRSSRRASEQGREELR